ncbi:RNA-binding protein, putative [Trypanosoma cruzi marinkellei]|uniref:RNA-binding protein, putative n=1 Tax=Trypanosoma cruzi marinkellei TaxID=85056 RepID=K2NMP6_TRYCR|nr:RNA-binding protein, putative [Trypanosoma cruzi marinkellei]
MYEQDTRFSAANTPLFSQLFGSSCSSGRKSCEKESFILPETCGGPFDGVCHGVTAPPPVSEMRASETGVMAGGDAAADEPHAVPSVKDAAFEEEDEPRTPDKPKVPFRQVMRELERRFQEQMKVHRGLRASMRQLDLLREEILLFQTEQRTASLASALYQQSMPFMESAGANVTVAAPIPQEPAKSNSASIVSPLLEKALKSYTEERSNKEALRVEENVPPKSKMTRRTISVDVIRPAEEPRPYKRVYYVPVVKPLEGARGDASLSASVISSSANAVSATVSYTEDFESSGGVSTDMPVTDISNSSSVATSSTSIKEDSSMRNSSSHSVNALTSMAGSSVIEEGNIDMRGSIRDDISLLSTLQEFYNACGSANRLMQALLGPDGDMRQPRIKNEDEATLEMKSVTKPRDDNGRHVWLSSLRRDIGDVRKLRRFIDQMKKNIKFLDCQRKAQEAKQKLLVKAQRIAKAHQRMRHDKSTLSDVMDDIIDLMENESKQSSDGDMVDEVSTVAALSRSSIVDDMVEDNVVDIANGSDLMGNEVVDEVDDQGTWGGGKPDDDDMSIPQEVLSELSWATAESDYANALVGASNVVDMVEDDVPLPSDGGETRDVDEDIPRVSLESSSSVTEVVDDVAGSFFDVSTNEQQRSILASKSYKDVVTDSPFSDLSNSEDADVSSVLPASSASSSSGSVSRQKKDNYDHDETDSAESALDALERDMQETEPRRVRALLSVYPPLFTPLYATDEMDTMAPGSCQEVPAQTPKCENAVAEEPIVHPTESEIKSAYVVSPRGDETLEATIEVPHTNAHSLYAADDLLAQLEWKERQLALLRQLRPKSAWEKEREKEGIEGKATMATQAPTALDEKAEYHWGVLETLLQCRFTCAENEPFDDDDDDMLDDNANESSWSDAYDGNSVQTNSDAELSADVEYSSQAV